MPEPESLPELESLPEPESLREPESLSDDVPAELSDHVRIADRTTEKSLLALLA